MSMGSEWLSTESQVTMQGPQKTLWSQGELLLHFTDLRTDTGISTEAALAWMGLLSSAFYQHTLGSYSNSQASVFSSTKEAIKALCHGVLGRIKSSEVTAAIIFVFL